MTPDSKHEKASSVWVFLLAVVPATAAWALIPLSFLLPGVDSTRAPYFDLTTTFSQVSYWVTQAGGKYGAPLVAAAMLFTLQKIPQ